MSAGIIMSGNQRTNPRWLADFSTYEKMSPFPAKLDKAAFLNHYGVDITLTGDNAQGDVSLAVTALAPPKPSVIPISSIGSLIIPRGSIIVFNAAAGKFAMTTDDVFLGNTTIPVQPLPTALVAATDTAKWDRFGNVFIPSGILVGRTFASRDGGTGLFEPITDPLLMDEMYLTVFDCVNLVINNDVELLRPKAGITVKENYLPDWSLYNADAGIARPIVAPVLTVAGTDGSLPAGTYFGGYSWATLSGETEVSPLQSIAVGATNHIAFASVIFPAGVTRRNFYVGRAPGDPNVQWQGSQGTAGAYSALTLGTGASPKTTNGTRSALGRQLDVIRRQYNTIKGFN